LTQQTGHYKPNAQGLADFMVEGKKRYWLYPPSIAAATYGEAGIAIDRSDGSIVGQQLEEVTE
jgi:hypothetical protein